MRGDLRWIDHRASGNHPAVPYERMRVLQAAQRILEQGGWCLYEACVDIPAQHWEARALLFDLTAEAVADAVRAEIEAEPQCDGRLTGCNRRTLCPDPRMGEHLCFVSDPATLTRARARR